MARPSSRINTLIRSNCDTKPEVPIWLLHQHSCLRGEELIVQSEGRQDVIDIVSMTTERRITLEMQNCKLTFAEVDNKNI